MRKIKIEIHVYTGAPLPTSKKAWWRIVATNGRLFCASEKMSERNAKKSIASIFKYIRSGNYKVETIEHPKKVIKD